MPAHQRHDGDSLTAQATAKTAASSWFRRPRNLVVLALALVAVIVGAFVVVNRDSGRSGSVTAKVGSGLNKTLADYFAANDITQTSVRPGQSGAPIVTIPVPPGWSAAGSDLQPGVYAELLYDDATNPGDVPFVEVLLSRLDGPADPAQVLEYAPGELRNLPDYDSVSQPMTSELSGFDAVQLAGLYTKDGEQRLIAQKTVVIPSPNGLFVLQMNADAPSADAPALQLATVVIDEKAAISP